MREPVIVSTARTPIGKAYRGAFNNLTGPGLASHAVRAAVARAGLETLGDGSDFASGSSDCPRIIQPVTIPPRKARLNKIHICQVNHNMGLFLLRPDIKFD